MHTIINTPVGILSRILINCTYGQFHDQFIFAKKAKFVYVLGQAAIPPLIKKLS
jgi:hypothetical protein